MLPPQVTLSLALAKQRQTGLMYALITEDGEHMLHHDKQHHNRHMPAHNKHQAINDPVC